MSFRIELQDNQPYLIEPVPDGDGDRSRPLTSAEYWIWAGLYRPMLAAALDADLSYSFDVPSLASVLVEQGLAKYAVRGLQERFPTSHLPKQRLVPTEVGEQLLRGEL